MPYWEKLFKILGIYNIDYHKKYRKYLHVKRYKTYINLVEKDIREKIESVNRKKIDKLFEEKFGTYQSCIEVDATKDIL